MRLIYIWTLLILLFSHLQLAYGGPSLPATLPRHEILLGVERIRLYRRSRRQQVHRVSKKKQLPGVEESKNSLTCGLLNTDGLGAGTFVDVENTILKKDLDFCVLLETKRRVEDPGSNIEIGGYTHTEV